MLLDAVDCVVGGTGGFGGGRPSEGLVVLSCEGDTGAGPGVTYGAK